MDTATAAVEARHLESTLVSHAPLTDLQDIGDDRRSIAEVLARHLEHADVVVHSPADARAAALLAALSPAAHHIRSTSPTTTWLGTGAHDHDRLVAQLQAGVPRGAAATEVAGSLWVATRPGTVFELEITGGSYELGAVDAWLAAVPGWDHADPHRRRQAERRWHPYYGDRAQDLVVTCADGDPASLLELLDSCPLTDAELAEGEDTWTGWVDPFSERPGRVAVTARPAAHVGRRRRRLRP